jgi:hypothetical protein
MGDFDLSGAIQEEAAELTEQEHLDRLANIVSRSIEETGWAVVRDIKTSLAAKTVNLMMRVLDKDKKDFVQKFFSPVILAAKGKFQVFCGTQYFEKKGEPGKIVYGWVFTFVATDMRDAVDTILSVADMYKPAKPQVTEVPMLGTGTPPGQVGSTRGSEGRKGARAIEIRR